MGRLEINHCYRSLVPFPAFYVGYLNHFKSNVTAQVWQSIHLIAPVRWLPFLATLPRHRCPLRQTKKLSLLPRPAHSPIIKRFFKELELFTVANEGTEYIACDALRIYLEQPCDEQSTMEKELAATQVHSLITNLLL